MSALADRLAPHYRRFGVAERLLLTGHSHQAWPDAALDGVLEAFDDAAQLVDEKWPRAFAAADAVRAGFRMWLDDADDAALALGANTHELVVRMLSSLDLRARPRIVTTGGEFHTLRRQLARLGEVPGVEVVVVDPEQLAEVVDEGTAAVFVSAVMFATGAVVEDLASIARACTCVGSELVVDAYHALGPTRFSVRDQGLQDAWVVGGGYKSVEKRLESAIHLRFGLPPHCSKELKDRIKKADHVAAYFEATVLAGFSVEEARKFFGQPRGITRETLLIDPLPAVEAQRLFTERFQVLEAQRLPARADI